VERKVDNLGLQGKISNIFYWFMADNLITKDKLIRKEQNKMYLIKVFLDIGAFRNENPKLMENCHCHFYIKPNERRE
jgi:hypothetical protein